MASETTATSSSAAAVASTTMAMAMSTSASMSMPMAFNTNNLASMLLSTSWAPTTVGQYVGSWFFLFILTIIWRALAYIQRRLDRYWILKYSSPTHKEILHEIPGVVHDAPNANTVLSSSVQAWRLSVNLPRAALAFVVQCLSYLLMISVMTMNVGFFFAVTIGYFVGELVFGRPSVK